MVRQYLHRVLGPLFGAECVHVEVGWTRPVFRWTVVVRVWGGLGSERFNFSESVFCLRYSSLKKARSFSKAGTTICRIASSMLFVVRRASVEPIPDGMFSIAL